MVFTTAAASSDTAEVFEVAEGSHVFTSKGDCFAEWDSLSAVQQQGLLEAKAVLDKAFIQARSMIASLDLTASAPLMGA
jgi:hypothetical protein